MADYLDEIKDIVNEYMLQGKIAVFVGAGVSKLSNYPSWTELVLSMAKRIGYEVLLRDQNGNECLSSNEYLKIPQIFYDDKGEKEYFKMVRRQLHIMKEPNDVHKIIMRLRPNHILTTNYDTLIEQAANRAGMAYSVINSDNKVATAPTRNYIVKVHGDFETNNFVLKESDYLDYETNFKLIDNLMKTIISTHLVIFIGYSLGDYNIKLILNWVRQVQKDSFIEPIFIHTDAKELTEVELVYYSSEHLRVVDANTLVEDSKNTSYMERYTKALTALLDPVRSEKWFRSEAWIVNHFYNIIEPLKDVHYLRTADMASIFSDSKIYYINQLQSEECQYLIETYKNRNKLSRKRAVQLEEIIIRFHNSGIDGIQSIKKVDQELNKRVRRGLIIDNNTFDFSYQDVRKRIDEYGDSLIDLYNKAYDLYWVGRLREAMDLYYELLADCYAHRRWVLYFFIQVNLFYLRQMVILLNGELSSFKGAVILGKPVKLWSDEEIHDMQLSHMITDIPAEIKKYTFLQKLTEKNYYKDDFVKAYQDNYEIEKNISKEMYTSAGQSKDQVSKIRIFDAINFIYGNKITFDKFAEHKNFTKIALQHRFKGMLSQNELASKSPWGNKDKNGYIDFQEALLLIRTFSFDDLFVFYDRENGKNLVLKRDAQKKFDKYIHDLLAYFVEIFVTTPERGTVIEYVTIKDEIKNALFLASYYLQESETIYECGQYLFQYVPGNELTIVQRLNIFGRLNEKFSSDQVQMRAVLENDLIERIERCNNGNDNVIGFERNDIAYEANSIKQWYPGYISIKIGNLIKESREKVVQEIKPLLVDII